MLAWYAETAVVATVLALVAALAGRIRGLAPAARHGLWLVVLLKLLAPPVVGWPIRFELPVSSPTAPATSAAAERMTERSRTSSLDEVLEEQAAWVDLADTEWPGELLAEYPSFEPPVISQAPPGRSEFGSIASGMVLPVLLSGATLMLGVHIRRVVRFRRQIVGAGEAPDFLIELAADVGRLLRITPPRLAVVDALHSPMLWCFGRTRLMVPKSLLATLRPEQWRSILAHELAHLKRGDPWVVRLEMLASVLWWWNPVFWLVRARLQSEADLACDGWAVAAFPEGRRAYAAALVDVCAFVSSAKPPAPALGVVSGAGRLIERRLTMILGGDISGRLSRGGLLAIATLALLALPSWTLVRAQDEPRRERPSAGARDDDGDKAAAEEKRARVARSEADAQAAKRKKEREAEVQEAREEVAKLREMLRKQQSEMQERVRVAETQIREAQARLREAMKATEGQAREAKERLAELLARRKVEVDARLVERPRRNPDGAEVRPPLPRIARSDSALEQRVDALEKKLDEALREIRSLRQERARPESENTQRSRAPRVRSRTPDPFDDESTLGLRYN